MSKKVLVSLDMNKNEIQNVKGQNLASTPSGVEESQFWYDTTDKTMKFYNGTSAVDMGRQGDTYTFSTGLTNTSGTITVTDYNKLVKNTATGDDSLTVMGTATSTYSSINIGKSSTVSSDSSIAIGKSASINSNSNDSIAIGRQASIATGSENISIGPYSSAGHNNSHSIAIGSSAQAKKESSIQIGTGSNSTAKTLSVGFYDATTPTNWQLLDGTTGYIPNARINMDSTPTSASTNAITSGGVYTALDNKVTKNNAITSATKCKITYDTKGLVTSGADLLATDIPDLSGTYVANTLLGANNGVATLGSDGKIPSSQLPSFVDDVIDSYIVSGATALSAGWLSATSGGSALTPETGVIYVILSSGDYQNKTYRWSGTTYVEISASPGAASESAAGIAELATQTEVNTGTDDTRIVTPLKLATYTSGMAKKYSTTNSALTASGGVCTWTVTHNLGNDVCVRVYDTSTNKEVIVDYALTSSSVATITINSTSNISSGAYKAVVIGG